MRSSRDLWRAVVAAFSPAPDEPPEPIVPEIAMPTWPTGPMRVEDRIALYRAVRRARYLKALAHAAQQRSDIGADEARRNDPLNSLECSFWKYAYEQRTDEARALRSALKAIIEAAPLSED